MNIKLIGNVAGSDLPAELTWVRLPDDIAEVCDIEITFRALNHDGREIYGPDEQGRHMGFTIERLPLKSAEPGAEFRKVTWHFPGIGEAYRDDESGGAELMPRPKQP